MTVTILNTPYEVRSFASGDAELSGADGRCNFWSKTIEISDCSDWVDSEKEQYRKQVLRHEIVHAFLFESGLAYNSAKTKCWAMNEEMVDWLAIQGPKIMEAWKRAGCLE